MRKALAIFALLVSGLWAATAIAAPAPTLELAAWVSKNTDLAVSQVAIAGPENVYSLEPLGPRLPTGEILALVRTEAVTTAWRDAHQFQSWDAHLLLDCQGGRVRVLRSASYAERDRGGPAKADDRGDAWFSPEADTPAATLLAAGCDPAFHWPLRGDAAAPSKAMRGPGPSFLQTAGAASPVAPPNASATAHDAVQLAQAQSDAQPNAHGGSIARAAAAVEPPRAVETPQAVVVAAAATGPAPAPPETRHEKAAPANMAQLASVATAEFAAPSLQNPSLQKVSFIAEPTLSEPSAAPPQALGDRPHASVLASVAAATRTCKRLVGAGRTWLWRRVEVALVHGDPQMPGRPEPAAART